MIRDHAPIWVYCRADTDTMNLITLVAGMRAKRVSEFVFRLVPCVRGLSRGSIEGLGRMAIEELDSGVRIGLIDAWRRISTTERAHLRDNMRTKKERTSHTLRCHASAARAA